MSSTALQHWKGDRSARLDELVKAHAQMGGTGRGRRWRTEQVNWSLIFRLAGEFQGFCKELHELGAETFAELATQNAAVRATLIAAFTRNRQLDRGNANKRSLKNDFGVFGLQWWPELEKRDRRVKMRSEHLDRLNEARNAIAHDEPEKVASLTADGYPLNLHTFWQWRKALNGLAVTMDGVLSEYLATLFRTTRPW